MTLRYSIWGREYGSDHDVEIVQVNSNPEAVRDGLYKKTLNVRHGQFGRVTKTAKYLTLRIIDNEKI